jgi:uncharacterized protein (TIGR03437 family)
VNVLVSNRVTLTGPVTVELGVNLNVVRGSIRVDPVVPALFTYPIGAKGFAVATFANDYALVAPENAIPGVTMRPALPGDYLTLYLTGFPLTDPVYPDGQVLKQAYPLSGPPRTQLKVRIAGVEDQSNLPW